MTMRHPAIEPVHPGEILVDVFKTLKAETGLTKADFTKAFGVTRPTVHKLMTREAALSPEMALRMEQVIGGDADTFLAMQADYDLWHARQRYSAKLKRIAA